VFSSGRIKVKRPEKSILLTGLRGVGKTVLLNEIERSAENIKKSCPHAADSPLVPPDCSGFQPRFSSMRK
jgi:hypothetical protein